MRWIDERTLRSFAMRHDARCSNSNIASILSWRSDARERDDEAGVHGVGRAQEHEGRVATGMPSPKGPPHNEVYVHNTARANSGIGVLCARSALIWRQGNIDEQQQAVLM